MLKLGFDIDGVLCSIIPELIEAAKKHNLIPKNIKISDIHDDLRKQFNLPDNSFDNALSAEFYSQLTPYENVIKDIQRWINNGHYVVFVTARSVSIKETTLEWLGKYNLLEKSKGCLHCPSAEKYKTIKELELDVFVDDYPKVIKTLIDIVPYLFLMKGPINQGHIDEYRHDWEEIRDYIDQLSLII